MWTGADGLGTAELVPLAPDTSSNSSIVMKNLNSQPMTPIGSLVRSIHLMISNDKPTFCGGVKDEFFSNMCFEYGSLTDSWKFATHLEGYRESYGSVTLNEKDFWLTGIYCPIRTHQTSPEMKATIEGHNVQDSSRDLGKYFF